MFPGKWLLLCLVMVAGAQSAFAARFLCSSIEPGDTAAIVALRLTGDAESRHAPWFQIVDPASEGFLPKEEYDAIRPGWQACIAGELVSSATSLWSRQPIGPRIAHPQARSTGKQQTVNIDLAWKVGLVVWLTLLAWLLTESYFAASQSIPADMKTFGIQFVQTFGLPLMQHRADNHPIKARLRFVSRSKGLEILIAPSDGRTYPNLSDHRNNLEYDVERVLRVLGNEQFVSGRLQAEGTWVVIPIRRKTDVKDAGVK